MVHKENTLPEDTLVPVVYNDYAERFASDGTFPNSQAATVHERHLAKEHTDSSTVL